MRLNTDLHLVPNLSISGAVLHPAIRRRGMHFTLFFKVVYLKNNRSGVSAILPYVEATLTRVCVSESSAARRGMLLCGQLVH